MHAAVVKQLFFSSRRYGRFSLHSVRCDACAIRLNIAFFSRFLVPDRMYSDSAGSIFWTANRSTKTRTFKTVQNVQRDKRMPVPPARSAAGPLARPLDQAARAEPSNTEQLARPPAR